MPRIVDREAQREELLRGSFELFARKGYGAVTMRGLARELGVSTGTLYHYFSGKDELYRAMFARLSRQDVDEASALVDPEAPLPEQLRTLRVFVNRRRQHLQRVLVVGLDVYRHDPGSHPFLAETVRTYREVLEERLGPGGAALGKVLISAMMGMLVHAVLDPDSVDIDEHFDLLVALLSNFG